MPSLYDIVVQLTNSALSDIERRRLVQDFAYHFGWMPSDSLTEAHLSLGLMPILH
jgi:hypothetical protein